MAIFTAKSSKKNGTGSTSDSDSDEKSKHLIASSHAFCYSCTNTSTNTNTNISDTFFGIHSFLLASWPMVHIILASLRRICLVSVILCTSANTNSKKKLLTKCPNSEAVIHKTTWCFFPTHREPHKIRTLVKWYWAFSFAGSAVLASIARSAARTGSLTRPLTQT